MRAIVRLVSLAVALVLVPASAWAQPVFVEVAREFVGGLMWLDADVRPALAENGTVAFTGSHDFDTFEPTRIFVGDGGALTSIDFATAGLFDPYSVDLNDAGQLAMMAARVDGSITYRGAYTTTLGSGVITTLYEGQEIPFDLAEPPPVRRNVALAESGMLAFSTFRNGQGALHRAVFGEPLTVLREASGIFYNTQDIDVSDSGVVAAQMEYGDPTAGLSRGILLFDEPGQTLQDIDTALERTGVGTQALPSINSQGQVAFAIDFPVTMTFFDPPGVCCEVLEEVELVTGVYVVDPGPWGVPKHPTRIASTADGFESFGRVDINDVGEVAFEASVDGAFGVFIGPDPVADKILAQGDTMGAQLFSVVRLGDINNAGSISLLTSDFNSTDRQIWRVDGAFEEPPPPPPPSPSPGERLRALLLWLLKLIFGR